MKMKVSIIIPVYNVEAYLDRCLKSIVNQTYENLEIIIVDDGSPDKCPFICDSWQLKDDRIIVIHKENGGLSSARNTGLDIATGDYICFVDSDDYISLDMIETMLDAALTYGVDVVTCGRIRVANSTEEEMYSLPKGKLFTGEKAIKELFCGGAIEEAAWDKLYKKEIFYSRRFPLGEINEDIVQTIEILGSCKEVYHVGKALYYYCENVGSITKSGYKSNKLIILKHLDEIKNYIIKNYPDLLGDFTILEVRYSQSVLYLLLDNENVYKTNKKDLNLFYDRFRIGFLNKNVRHKMPSKERVKGWLIYSKLYYPLHAFKNRFL